MKQEPKQNLTKPNDINLYTALAIFIGVAEHIIDDILDAVEAENLPHIEKLATKLSMHSSKAQLAAFTEDANNLVTAARGKNFSAVKSLTEKLRGAFEQMTRSVDFTDLEQRIILEEKSACFGDGADNLQ